MSPFLTIATIWILIGIFGTLMFVLAMQADKKRRSMLATFAEELGLLYTDALDDSDESNFAGFQLSQQGHSHKIANVIVADSGELRMVVFDYRFTVGSGKNQSTRRQSVVMATSKLMNLPSFSIAPESFFHRIGELFGYKDIDFEDDPRFSGQFLLRGEDEAAIRSFFNSERRHRFHDFPDVTVEGVGNHFLFYKPGKRWKVEETKELMNKALSIFSILQD